VTEVGPGIVFTKAALRAAFPTIEQVDRRMRDLRADGWVIATNRDDVSLSPNELRLVSVGARVWEDGYRPSSSLPTAAERRAAFARDDYLCRHCGIGAGEPHLDDPLRTAKLVAARVQASNGEALLTLCDRCFSGRAPTESLESVFIDLRKLQRSELEQLKGWARQGRRSWSQLEVAWARVRRLPASGRDAVEAALERELTR
jgi:5-methylcytosine-specific restriction endonuclease McrA